MLTFPRGKRATRRDSWSRRHASVLVNQGHSHERHHRSGQARPDHLPVASGRNPWRRRSPSVSWSRRQIIQEGALSRRAARLGARRTGAAVIPHLWHPLLWIRQGTLWTRIFIEEIERLLCTAAGSTRNGDTPSAARPQLGAVSFLHRFGSAINRHVHLHACVTDGVFMPNGDGLPASLRRQREGEAAG
jgi:hypothetical protein